MWKIQREKPFKLRSLDQPKSSRVNENSIGGGGRGGKGGLVAGNSWHWGTGWLKQVFLPRLSLQVSSKMALPLGPPDLPCRGISTKNADLHARGVASLLWTDSLLLLLLTLATVQTRMRSVTRAIRSTKKKRAFTR